jgi:hypothetical protein
VKPPSVGIPIFINCVFLTCLCLFQLNGLFASNTGCILVEWNHILQREIKRRMKEIQEFELKTRELENSYDAMKNYVEEVMKEVRGEHTHRCFIDLHLTALLPLQLKWVLLLFPPAAYPSLQP